MIIYKTTNLVNQKIYVGQTVHDDPSYLGGGVLIKRAIRKYGKDNFFRETLEKCDTIEHLNEREYFWIEKLNARDPLIGYNLDFGGKNNAHSDQTREKIRQSKLGKKLSEDHKRNIGIASSNRGPATKLKMSESSKRWKSEHPEKWENTIKRIQDTKRKNGFWESEEFKNRQRLLHEKNKKYETLISQKTMNGELVRIWNGLSEIRQVHPSWGTCSNISRMLRDLSRKHAHGFVWQFHQEL